MTNYIISFTVYTLAMSGLIFLALFIYKKAMNGSISSKNSKLLSVEETMSISPRKTLMIVKAGEERFLIASDIDKTTLLAKLDNNEKFQEEKYKNVTDTNTEPVDLSINFPQINIINEETIEKKQDTNKITSPKKKEEKPVHLEIIKDTNLKTSENKAPKRKPKTNKNVSIDVVDSQNHGFSTMKEMAYKINEM